MWLHLACGLSKLNCRKARDDLVEIVESVSQRFGVDSSFVSSTPQDVRTINKRLNLEASLERYLCCPTCFALYDIEIAPEDCGYQASSKSQPCGTRLFKSNALLGLLKPKIFVEPQPKKKNTSRFASAFRPASTKNSNFNICNAKHNSVAEMVPQFTYG
ncbi:hypothetical protein O181_061216 [Austropuccinia psidii MF-1]|uniref:Uncharacterized protein n=1 Tax=Austropuccinia psidii MF-1 TaxID=1389203 RepID=A0A9Q3HXA7_9BASI|nr:hypothetical protein [Austropuccinia psidii MF-1]